MSKVPMVRTWCLAKASSRSEGWRLPSAPAKVPAWPNFHHKEAHNLGRPVKVQPPPGCRHELIPAPHALPPLTTLMSYISLPML